MYKKIVVQPKITGFIDLSPPRQLQTELEQKELEIPANKEDLKRSN
jgi:hypothetical protein